MDSASIVATTILLSAVSALIYAVSTQARQAYDKWRARRTVSLRIASVDSPGWKWLLAWLEAADGAVGRSVHRRMQHVRMRGRADADYGFMPNDMREPMRFAYKGRLFQMILAEERIEGVTLTYAGSLDSQRLAATIWTSGGTIDVFHELLEEMRAAHARDEATSTAVSVPLANQGGQPQWATVRCCAPRLMDTIILPEAGRKDMIADLDAFAHPEARARYLSQSIPYRRGWLLHGPPGNGKSSCALAIAGRLQTELRLLSLNDPKLTDAGLVDLINVHPLRSCPRKLAVVVLEDVDALFASRETPAAPGEAPSKPAVTFSGLLNALDGAGAPESVLIIMTTNYPERLDPALIRPGRVDRRFEFCAPTDDMIKQMLRRFMPHADVEDEDVFVRRCRAKGETLSLALVQEEARLFVKK